MEVLVNAAMSADGKLSTVDRRQVRISGPSDFARVDRLRAAVDAILVGIGTVLADDPHLTVNADELRSERIQEGRHAHPARIVADSRARTPVDAQILDDASASHVLIADSASAERVDALADRASIHRVGTEQVNFETGLQSLAAQGIESILVEGGGEVIFSLLEARLVDRLLVFVGGQVIGGRDAPTLADGEGFTDEAAFVDLTLERVERLDDGVLLEWVLSNGN